MFIEVHMNLTVFTYNQIPIKVSYMLLYFVNIFGSYTYKVKTNVHMNHSLKDIGILKSQ